MNRHMINALLSDTSLQTLSPQESAKLLIQAVQRKAKDRNLDSTLTLSQVTALCELSTCPATGIQFDMRRGVWLPFRQSLDRIDNTKGYHLDNVQVVANIYNQAKSSWPEEYIDQMCLGRAAVLEHEAREDAFNAGIREGRD